MVNERFGSKVNFEMPSFVLIGRAIIRLNINGLEVVVVGTVSGEPVSALLPCLTEKKQGRFLKLRFNGLPARRVRANDGARPRGIP